MRTHLIRAAVAVAMLFAAAAPPAMAQSLVRGRVVDAKGQPVADAVVVFEAQNVKATRNAKSDGKGEFLVIGLTSGQYKVTASKDGIGTDVVTIPVTQGQNQPVTFTLRPAAPAGANLGPTGPSAADKAALAAIQALATQGTDHLKAGRNDEAIAAFTEVTTKAPQCPECFFNLGMAYGNKKQYADAETAFKKVIELKPDHAGAYTQLASIYNAQKKFKEAQAMSAEASKRLAAGGAGGNATALYNAAVIAWNGNDFAKAHELLTQAVKAEPAHADSHFMLGRVLINLGKLGEAATEFETYLKLAPNGPNAKEAQANFDALKAYRK